MIQVILKSPVEELLLIDFGGAEFQRGFLFLDHHGSGDRARIEFFALETILKAFSLASVLVAKERRMARSRRGEPGKVERSWAALRTRIGNRASASSHDASPPETDSAAESVAIISAGADFLYVPPAEQSGFAIQHPGGLANATTLTDAAGRTFLRLSDGASDAPSLGTTGGFGIQVPDAIERAASGNDIRIRVIARAEPGTVSTRFAIAYSTNEVGNSGWQWFTTVPDWTMYEMRYAVPQMRDGRGDYIGVLPDEAGKPAVEVCAVALVVTKS